MKAKVLLRRWWGSVELGSYDKSTGTITARVHIYPWTRLLFWLFAVEG